MRGLWRDMRTHQLAAALSLVFWVALWGTTVATWLYDDAGYSTGMHPLLFALHFLPPLVAGILVGWWRKALGGGLTRGALAGLLYSVADFFVLLIWSAALIGLGRVERGNAF